MLLTIFGVYLKVGRKIIMHNIIQQNFAGVVIIIFLILFILTAGNFERKINRLFLGAAICILLLIVEELLEEYFAAASEPSVIRSILSAIGYTLRPISVYFLAMVINRNSKKNIFWISIPMVINAIIVFSSIPLKTVFFYTDANEFVRGPLWFVPFVVAAFYVILLLMFTVQECKKSDRTEAITILAIVFISVVSTIMESVFGFSAIQSASSGISITFYYLFFHTNQNNKDTLTGAFIRRRFYLDAKNYSSTLTAVISLDLNDLKTLNDKYGHMQGDKALVTMTNIVRKCITNKSVLYRTGGDEFMILCHKMSEQKVQELIEQIQSEMEKTKYSCAIGYALYSNQKGLDLVCQFADAAMYKNKVEMKKAKTLAERN